MNSRDYLKKYEANGFIVLNKIFSEKDIKKIYLDLIKIKKILPKIKKRKIYHKTPDGKINTIHNIQEFYKNNRIQKIVNKKKLKSIYITIYAQFVICFFLKVYNGQNFYNSKLHHLDFLLNECTWRWDILILLDLNEKNY